MAVPTVRASVTNDYAADENDTSYTLSVPSGAAAGDMLLFIFSHLSGRTINEPAGVTSLSEANTTFGLSIFYRVMVAGDTSFTFTSSSTYAYANGVCICVTGCATDAPAIGTATAGNNSSAACPAVTAPANESLILWIVASAASQSSHGTATEVFDLDSASACHAACYSGSGNAGSVSGITISLNAWEDYRVQSLAIGPGGGGGGASAGGVMLLMDHFNGGVAL